MKITKEAKESVLSFRVTEKEKTLIRGLFGESDNIRKFIIKSIQDPNTLERIREVRNES